MTGYHLLRFLTLIVQFIPLRVHYFFSDILFLIVYHVVRYRRKVVERNLRNSFPTYSECELKTLTRKYYHHMCDSIVETLYFDRISKEEIMRRHRYENADLITGYLKQGRNVVLMMGHYNNWEWNCNFPLFEPDAEGYVIYKKLKSPSSERFFFNLRSRFGAIPLERADTFKTLYKAHQEHRPTVSAFLMDQTPRVYEIQYWTNFLNQDTPVLTGTEKLAKRLDAVAVYCEIKKIKRGYNVVAFTLITENAKDTEPFELTEKATRMLEESIIRRPELWLWSHKRWKHKRVIEPVTESK